MIFIYNISIVKNYKITKQKGQLMNYYYIVFILTTIIFQQCSGMESTFIPEMLRPSSVGNLCLILALHNHGKSKPISIIDQNEQGPHVLCHIDLKFIDGTDKNNSEIEREIEFYEERFKAKPLSAILRAPNNMWIYCISAFNASQFSFDAEGKFMLNGKVLIKKYRHKKLDFESFAGERITITKQNFPKNTYKAVFKDWNDKSYVLYIDGRDNTITDRYPS